VRPSRGGGAGGETDAAPLRCRLDPRNRAVASPPPNLPLRCAKGEGQDTAQPSAKRIFAPSLAKQERVGEELPALRACPKEGIRQLDTQVPGVGGTASKTILCARIDHHRAPSSRPARGRREKHRGPKPSSLRRSLQGTAGQRINVIDWMGGRMVQMTTCTDDGEQMRVIKTPKALAFTALACRRAEPPEKPAARAGKRGWRRICPDTRPRRAMIRPPRPAAGDWPVPGKTDAAPATPA
jgi:hypothetical protein